MKTPKPWTSTNLNFSGSCWFLVENHLDGIVLQFLLQTKGPLCFLFEWQLNIQNRALMLGILDMFGWYLWTSSWWLMFLIPRFKGKLKSDLTLSQVKPNNYIALYVLLTDLHFESASMDLHWILSWKLLMTDHMECIPPLKNNCLCGISLCCCSNTSEVYMITVLQNLWVLRTQPSLLKQQAKLSTYFWPRVCWICQAYTKDNSVTEWNCVEEKS